MGDTTTLSCSHLGAIAHCLATAADQEAVRGPLDLAARALGHLSINLHVHVHAEACVGGLWIEKKFYVGTKELRRNVYKYQPRKSKQIAPPQRTTTFHGNSYRIYQSDC